MNEHKSISSFNSPLEAGIRSVNILLHSYPAKYDLQRLVIFDHYVVHTDDIGGPESLHARIPMRSAEILVRRNLIEKGLLIMMSRNLIERITDDRGVSYQAGEMSQPFLNSLETPYLKALSERAAWVVKNFGEFDDDQLRATTRRFFSNWIEQFQNAQTGLGSSI